MEGGRGKPRLKGGMKGYDLNQE